MARLMATPEHEAGFPANDGRVAWRLTTGPGRRAVLTMGLLLAMFGRAGSARAHSELRRSVPAPGAVLAQAPERIELVFNERVQLTALRLHRSGGEEIALPRRTIRAADSETIALPPLAAGDYRVEWRIISADGHPAGGAIPFRILAPGER
jgi:methionine-rich copper-binding protein CopC